MTHFCQLFFLWNVEATERYTLYAGEARMLLHIYNMNGKSTMGKLK